MCLESKKLGHKEKEREYNTFQEAKIKSPGRPGRGKGVWGIEVDIVQGAGARRGGGGLIGKQRTKGGMIGTEIEMF